MAKMQSDIVNEYIAQLEQGTIVTDELFIPDISRRFFRPYSSIEITKEVVNVPSLRGLYSKSFLKIAQGFISLFTYKQDLVSIEWVINEPTITVERAKGFRQKQYTTEEDIQELTNFIIFLLKSRKNIVSIKWELGTDSVLISYVA